jgi:CRISPR-associated protein Cmr1
LSEIAGFKKLTATFEIITPMFIGDGLQKADSVRPTSVKGALRFWWRALVWPRLITKYQTQSSALRELREQEVILFGAAVNGDFGGQGLVSVRVFDTDNEPKTISSWPTDANSGSGYIAYGLLATQQEGHKEALQEGHQFNIQLNCRKLTIKQEDELKETLLLFGRMGALGSRARRANGCVQIITLQGESMQLDKRGYEQWINAQFTQTNNFPPFTALNQHCLARYLTVKNDARRAHGEIGLVYKNYRSGPNKKIRGRDKEKLGLPLKNSNEAARRASPLFLHIYKLSENEFLPVMLFIPADFDGTARDMSVFYESILPLLKGPF